MVGIGEKEMLKGRAEAYIRAIMLISVGIDKEIYGQTNVNQSNEEQLAHIDKNKIPKYIRFITKMGADIDSQYVKAMLKMKNGYEEYCKIIADNNKKR